MSVVLRDLGVVPVDEVVRLLGPSLVLLLLLTAFLGSFFALLLKDCWERFVDWVASQKR